VNFWWTLDTTTNSPDVGELRVGEGFAENTNAFYLQLNPIVGTNTISRVWNAAYFRSPNSAIRVEVTYQSIGGIQESSIALGNFTVYCRPDKYPQPRFDTISQSLWPQLKLHLPPTPTGEWRTISGILPRSTAKYLKPSFAITQQAVITDVYEVLIDKITFNPVSIDEGITTTLVNNIATCNINASRFHYIDLEPASANVTIDMIGALQSNEICAINMYVIQDSGAPRSITWKYNNNTTPFKWAGGTAPSLTAAGGAVDLFTFTTWNGGTTWIGSAEQDVS